MDNFYRIFVDYRDFIYSGIAKYGLGCMPIVKKQSNFVLVFLRYLFWCLLKRIRSKLSIN